MSTLAKSSRRRALAPEVVQTSAMDCGPAALKCLLEGFGIAVSYGRLREACQTDVDGTSIDTIEVVANDLGLVAEQEMIPVDHLFLDAAQCLPALVVVRHAEGSTHFVVVWRRCGPWLQVMDPAVGRRWVGYRRFMEEVFRHQLSVPAADWREWAASNDFVDALRERMSRLGAGPQAAKELIDKALADDGWFTLGVLDASTRLVGMIVDAGGIGPGAAAKLLATLFQQTCDSPHDIFRIIPPDYWSVTPDPASVERRQHRLLMRGAVLLRVSARVARELGTEGEAEGEAPRPLSPELRAALHEKPQHPLRSLWHLLRGDGILAPLALLAAMSLAAGATLVEALLFRGIFDIGALLNVGSQRLVAFLGLLAFMGLVASFQIPIVSESMRFGRRLDARLRMALLRKLPRLTDRYFQSRSISDMADRGHTIHVIRHVPGMGIHFVQSLWELAFTLTGITLIDPRSALFAGMVAAVVLVVPAIFQPVINERDLRVRSHSAALSGFYLDSLLGLVPIRAHRAERAVRHQHESLLVEWVRATRRLVRISIMADGVQSFVCTGLVAALLVEHFLRAEGVTGADLLLVYWTLKLSGVGHAITTLAHQYPSQRNALLRFLEPLAAPEQGSAAGRVADDGAVQAAPAAVDARDVITRDRRPRGAVRIDIENGSVVAAGHTILRDIELRIAPGEHVAIVGRSGAGKSTLLGLMLGWHRLAAGRVLVDGTELADTALEELRRETAWVDPAIQIWNKSLLANLAYSSPDSDLGRTGAAIDAARLRGVLQKLPDGLQTALGEGGGLLSGGEGQRVRLGRALVQSDVRLALLDEPFRGMDRGQRSALLSEARRHWRGATLLCVTHDVSETLDFDRVLVIEDGQIVEDDRPDDLAEQPSRYRELLESERLVRERMWAGGQWQRIRVEDGHVERVG